VNKCGGFKRSVRSDKILIYALEPKIYNLKICTQMYLISKAP